MQARHRWTLVAPLALLLGACASQGDAQAPVAPATASADARQAQVDRLMAAYAGDGPGASLLVLQDGKPLVRRGYGHANLEQVAAAGPATNYRLASVSKQFTAAAILLLAEDGKLSIDDPVRKWLPSLPKVADTMTVRQLVVHTTGLLDYESLMAKPYPGQISDAGVLALMEKEDRTYFPVGSTYRYSNTGYALLALIVERASGKSFADFTRERIFAPLGMAHTSAGPALTRRAYGHSFVNGAWQRTDQNAYSAVLGDGGIYSSIDDLARWSTALDEGRLFNQASRELMFSHQVEVSKEPTPVYYGFGWRVTDEKQWHSGESVGFRNALVRWPKQRLTVVILSNRNEPTPLDLVQEIGQLFLDREAAASP